MTISVPSHTAANHLRYLSSTLVQLITKQSITFKQLNTIDIIVSYATSVPNNSSLGASSAGLAQIHQNPASKLRNKSLSANTRETITYTAKHVITDPKLKQALLKLANSDT